VPTRAKIRGIISKLEKQRSDLKEIISVLREISHLSPQGVADPSLDDHEKRLLTEALHRTEGNQTEAARILKVSRDKVRYKMAKHGLNRKQ
jgi:DNA-binding NtrC family response regulator